MGPAAADEIYQIVPDDVLPADTPVVLLEGDGWVVYLIRENTPLTTVIAELNRFATHVVRHGLWRQQTESLPPQLQHAD